MEIGGEARPGRRFAANAEAILASGRSAARLLCCLEIPIRKVIFITVVLRILYS
jgi:hypothetical protein